MGVVLLFGSLLILILFGVPVGIAVGLSCIVTMVLYGDLPFMLISQTSFTGMDSFPLLAVPFFILTGVLMGTGGIAKRLIDVASALLGFVTGGLAMVVTFSCMFFGAISGSAVATVSAIGTFMIPEMRKKGYSAGFSTALTATAGTIGVVIPPSIPFIIYGVTTQTSIGDLFIAGLFPGILMGVALMTVSYFMAKKRGYQGTTKFIGMKKVLQTMWSAKLALLTPIIILGGIYGGIFTPTEAAAVAVVYSFIIGRFVYKELDNKKIYKSIYDAAVINAVTMFLIGFSTTFARYLTIEQIPQQLASLLVSVTENEIVLLLLINLFLLIVGALIDPIPAILILAPILLPVATVLGLSPIHFGVIMVLNLAIGFITPPYGLNLFVATAISGLSMEEIIRNLWAFLASVLVVLMLVTFIPGISMFMVKLIGN